MKTKNTRSFLGRLLLAVSHTGNEHITWLITRVKAETHLILIGIALFYIDIFFTNPLTGAFNLLCLSNHHVGKLESNVKRWDYCSSLRILLGKSKEHIRIVLGFFIRGESRSKRGKPEQTRENRFGVKFEDWSGALGSTCSFCLFFASFLQQEKSFWSCLTGAYMVDQIRRHQMAQK